MPFTEIRQSGAGAVTKQEIKFHSRLSINCSWNDQADLLRGYLYTHIWSSEENCGLEI